MIICKHGIQFEVDIKNKYLHWTSVMQNRWEPTTFEIFYQFLDKEHSMIDIGAWIGALSLFGGNFAKTVYAIEPDPVAYPEIKDNIKLNPKLDIRLFDCAIDFQTGTRYFGNGVHGESLGDSTSSVYMVKRSSEPVKVNTMTLTEFITANNITDCNFIKIDVEGSEVEIITSSKEWIEKNKPTIHLSLHPKVYAMFHLDFAKMLNVLKCYKHVYCGESQLRPFKSEITIQDVIEDLQTHTGWDFIRDIVVTDSDTAWTKR